LALSTDKIWFMVFNPTFKNISVISFPSADWWRNSEYPEKTCDLSQVTDKFYHTSPWTGFELTTLVLIDIVCTGSCKSNYLTITATTAPSTDKKSIHSHMVYKEKQDKEVSTTILKYNCTVSYMYISIEQ
jgi:hypothetical protein